MEGAVLANKAEKNKALHDSSHRRDQDMQTSDTAQKQHAPRYRRSPRSPVAKRDVGRAARGGEAARQPMIINKLQRYTVQHREHSQYFIITIHGG